MIDVSINLILTYPSDPRNTNPSQLRLYFEYGRSTEGRLSRMTRADRSLTAPITLSGWYDPLVVEEVPVKPHSSVVTFYGMSHAVRLALALGRTSNRFTPRIVGAPAAPTNWSYGAYLRDRGGGKSRAVVLTLMSNSLPMITTLSAATWSFDLPMPYTMDRFSLDKTGVRLQMEHPPFSSFDEYVEAFNDPARWSAVRSAFAERDTMYNAFVFRANILDHSAFIRLIRRAYGQRLLRGARNAVLNGEGFHADSEQVQVARVMVREFATQARNDGVLPVIYLVNNFGFSDYLFKALSPVLLEEKIPFLSSHTIISPNDPRGYLPDSHFTDEVDERLSKALERILEESDGASVPRSPS
jgi:hypothetical protein